MESYGWLASVAPLGGWLLFVLALLGMGFLAAPLPATGLVVLGFLWLLGAPPWLMGASALTLAWLSVVPLRRVTVSRAVMGLMTRLKLLPAISDTERTALEAGQVWVEGELFSGKPDFDRLRHQPYAGLDEGEARFCDDQCAHLAALASDWEVYQHGDLPERVWDFLKQERFFGLIIPKEYGGLGFSARGHSEVIARLGACSHTLAVTVMVPNSLGPGELILHHGTQAQKDYYLPRLARGEEVPCFALTEPDAGSDAASIVSSGVVLRGEEGQAMLRLNWRKRYVTLAPVATLIGLAVKLRDPDNLLGRGRSPGITCVLVPASTPGVVVGQRHNPMGVPFMNSPVEGRDVVVPAKRIIGGPEGAGQGWRMLIECLAAGRGISLPSLSAGGARGLLRTTSAYAAIRRQFGGPIGRFEGVEEPLARIAGLAYLMEAARVYVVGAVDSGLKPAIASAIAKYHQTELARQLVNDAMDLMGGAAISRGPRNLVANGYIAAPIGITVEGANILTRSLIIFGQGALRCHPWLYRELTAVAHQDLAGFDRAFWGHLGHFARNACRWLLLSLTRGHLAAVPAGVGARYWRRLAWSSAAFATLADLALATLGGRLKSRESLSGRFADVLSWMLLACATLRRYEAEGQRADHQPVFEWALEHSLARLEEGLDGILGNFGVPVLGALLRGPVRLGSRLNRLGAGPRDALGHTVAREVQEPGALRDSLLGGLIPATPELEAAHRLERAFLLGAQAGEVLDRIGRAVRDKRLPRRTPGELIPEAFGAGVISAAETRLLDEAEAARQDSIQVDSFPLEEFRPMLLDKRPAEVPHHGRRVA